MKDIVDGAMEAYAEAHCSLEDPLLAELTRETQAKAKVPQMQSGHVEGLLLRFLVQILGAKRVLEIGTFTGYSALTMAMGMGEGGTVITCDLDPIATDMAKSFWKRSPHGSKIDLRLGPATHTLKSLSGPFDLVFIDADKENYIHYWEDVAPKVRLGGIIVVDNVLWSGRVLAPKDPTDHAIVAFNKHALSDSRFEKVMLTVRDGVTVARKLYE